MTGHDPKEIGFNLLAVAVIVAAAFGYADFHPAPWVPAAATLLAPAINLLLHYWHHRV